jgi:hypothetical protein
MKQKLMLVAMLIMTLALGAACSDKDNLSSEDAGKVYAAVSTAVGEATSEVMMNMGSMGMKIKADEDWTFGEDGSFSGTVEGPNGGSASITGSGSFSEESYNYNFTITFEGYATTDYQTSEELILDGEVTYAYEGTQSTFKADYTGEVTASGAVEGTATFDLHMEVTEGSISISGTVGGQEVGGSYDY